MSQAGERQHPCMRRESPGDVHPILLAALDLVENCLPVVFLQHGLKAPLAGPEGSWHILSDPVEEVEAAKALFSRSRPPNLAACLAPKYGSSLVVVDVETQATTEVWTRLQALGVNSGGDCWISRTGRGGYHIFYYSEVDPPPRVIRADRLPIDLLADGFAVVPPSDTYLEAQGGGPYRWVQGHAPSDIPLAELQPVPERLLAWWEECAEPRDRLEAAGPHTDSKGAAWSLLTEPILEGTRNAALARLGGWLKLYHPYPVLLKLLLAINAGRCVPPLPEREVEAVARSVAKYPQTGVTGHPRAVVPSFVRREAHDGS